MSPFFLLSIAFLSVCISSLNYNEWTEVTLPSLPYTNDQMAIAYDSDSNMIFLLGGFNHYKGLISYNISNNTFNNLGNVLTSNLWGISQYFTQINNILYIIDESDWYFNTFNVNTLQFTLYYNSIDISIPGNVYGGPSSCLTSINLNDNDNEYLIVIGGSTGSTGTLKQVLILNISSNLWLNNVPTLQQGRRFLSCNTLNNRIYAIGGSHGSGNLNTVEFLNVPNTDYLMNTHNNTNWEYLEDTLESLNGISESTTVKYQNDILIIGGLDYNQSTFPWTNIYIDQINVIHTLTNTITVEGYLSFPTRRSAAVIVDNIGYVFAGVNNFIPDPPPNYLDKWQYIDLYPTPVPTIAPSMAPTGNTMDPTTAPSMVPSNDPSMAPILFPSIAPSLVPTNNPSNTPISPPSSLPSIAPLLTPTYSPSLAPSAWPSDSLSKSPSNSPFNSPSGYPTKTMRPSITDNASHNDIYVYTLLFCILFVLW